MSSPLDRRHMLNDTGWHGPDGTWGDGVQHHVIHDLVELTEDMRRHNGIPGLEIVNPAEPDFAEAAATLLHRDGFVCVANVMSPDFRAALLARANEAMEEIVARDAQGC